VLLLQEVMTEEKSAVICDLKPHTWYTIELKARPLTSRGHVTGFWSEAVADMELTKEDGKIFISRKNLAMFYVIIINCH
jgi:hypothetical protein